MRVLQQLAVSVGLLSLAACNQGAKEQQADNIEATAEMKADNLEEAADNATSDARENSLENQASQVREKGEERADKTRSSADLDGNSADDTVSGNSTSR